MTTSKHQVGGQEILLTDLLNASFSALIKFKKEIIEKNRLYNQTQEKQFPEILGAYSREVIKDIKTTCKALDNLLDTLAR